ncbi:hypothetical protein PIB30_065895 [Stylosanthes scabra]|uniref:Uncharacterized protein n=1 Tax=Stylosanthes scabra TaxID=79078 RepID=A0ABU6YLJ8_9FABA|nr:hypothetical protein [Stylosanthes scabra]
MAGKAKEVEENSYSVDQATSETKMSMESRPEESSKPIREVLEDMKKQGKKVAFADTGRDAEKNVEVETKKMMQIDEAQRQKEDHIIQQQPLTGKEIIKAEVNTQDR